MQLQSRGKINQVAPDRLMLKEGGGCLAIFGIPFFLAGIFMILGGFGIIPIENSPETMDLSWIVFIMMGLIFTAVGGVLALGRRRLVLDISRGTLTRSIGLLVPMRHTELSLHFYDSVNLRFAPGDSDSADRYLVSLRAKDGGKDFDLYSSTQYGDSREQAVLVGNFLCIPMVDASTDHETVIQSDKLNTAFGGQPAENEEHDFEVAQPAVMRTKIQQLPDGIQIVIPEKVFKPARFAKYVFSALILIIIIPEFVSFFRDTNTPDVIKYVFLGFPILIFGILPLIGMIFSIMRASKTRTVVTVNAGGIEIEYHGIWRRRVNRVPAADILGLDYSTAETVWKSSLQRAAQQKRNQGSGDFGSTGYDGRTPRWIQAFRKFVKSKGVIIKSRSGLVTFGAGLPDQEVQYLFMLVKRVLGLRPT